MNARRVCKRWKRFLPIADHERCLYWEKIINPWASFGHEEYQQYRLFGDKHIKHGWHVTYTNDKVVNMTKYVNGVNHGLSMNYGSCIFLHNKGRLVEQYQYEGDKLQCWKNTYNNDREADSWDHGDSCRKTEWNKDKLVHYSEGPVKNQTMNVQFYIPGNPEMLKIPNILSGKDVIPLDQVVPDPSRWNYARRYYYQPIGKYTKLLPTVSTIEYFANGTSIRSVFRPNGKIRSTTNMFQGTHHGYCWSYDVNGQLMHCGRYNMGLLEWEKHYHKKRSSPLPSL